MAGTAIPNKLFRNFVFYCASTRTEKRNPSSSLHVSRRLGRPGETKGRCGRMEGKLAHRLLSNNYMGLGNSQLNRCQTSLAFFNGCQPFASRRSTSMPRWIVASPAA